MQTTEQREAAAKEVLQDWLNQQGHERCWNYYPVLKQLAEIFGLQPPTDLGLPSRGQFRTQCRVYESQQYGEQTSPGRLVGNEQYWAYLPQGSGFGELVDIWQNIGLGLSEVIAQASDKFSAMSIVEALIKREAKEENDRT